MKIGSSHSGRITKKPLRKQLASGAELPTEAAVSSYAGELDGELDGELGLNVPALAVNKEPPSQGLRNRQPFPIPIMCLENHPNLKRNKTGS